MYQYAEGFWVLMHSVDSIVDDETTTLSSNPAIQIPDPQTEGT
jgi:hypothetical protein